MPKRKNFLTPQSKWTLLLVGGFCIIYVGLHWQNLLPVRAPMPPSVVSSVQISANNDILGIPALNISTPIVYSSATNESGIQQDLESGVVHLAGTANPGDVGNAYIVGHSSNFKDAPGSFNEVFKNLPNIRVGDEITIRQGTRQLRFVVTKTQVVEPTELWVMSQATDGAKILTLQTSYPVGTAKQRFVAIAKLEE